VIRRASAALVAAFALCAPAAPAQEADPHRPIDLRYRGKYLGDPWFNGQTERFKQAADEGFQRAADGLGIDRATLDLSKFRVYMSDVRPDSSTWVAFRGNWMECSGYPGDATGIQLRISTESMRNGFGADLAQGITHELTHALMRATCPGYRTTPKWIREGMAVFIAEQGPGRMTQHLTIPRYAANPTSLCNGLEEFGGTHALNDYTEDYLAMCFIDRAGEGGAGGVKQLQALLTAGTPWRGAVQELTGMAWPDFKAAALLYATAELAKRQNDDLRAFAKVATLRMQRKYAEAIVAADAYLAAFPKSPYRKMGYYHRARAYHATKRYRKAITDFATAHAIGTPFTGYDDDLLFWWGWDLFKTGQYAKAVPLFAELLRDHVAYNDPTAAAYFWALSLANAKDPGAKAALTKVMRAFPSPKESWMMPAATKALAKVDAAAPPTKK
jgi:hypothetical protein